MKNPPTTFQLIYSQTKRQTAL